MGLIETVTVTLGSAIAKGILKQWLKDSSIASESGSSIVDLIKSKTSDLIAQRRATRLFESIGEKVAENLLVVFDAEGINIPENGRIAVTIAAAETIEKAKIDSKLLAEKNLEPTTLATLLFE